MKTSVCIIKTQYYSVKNYSYLIVDENTKEAAIVDPSWELLKINALINEKGVKITDILLTHHHYDHVNLVKPLVEKFNAKVYIHYYEIEMYNFKSKNLIPIKDSDYITLGSSLIECLHTPGHTSGSVCYFIEDCLFTGDTIFIEGCGVCDLKGGSASEMYSNVERIKNLSPNTLIYPGHSYGKEPGCELSYLFKNNIYFHLKKDDFIFFRMRKKQSGLFDFK